MKDKTTFLAAGLAVIAVAILAVNYFTKGPSIVEKEKEVNIVKNYSNFYTVNSCLYRLITYISSEDKDSLLLVLSDDYKKNNKIDKDNILSIFPTVEEGSTFVSRKMYYEDINDSVKKFYVYGYIEANQIFDDVSVDELDRKYTYFVVYLDTESKIFTVEPYAGNIFLEGDIDE